MEPAVGFGERVTALVKAAPSQNELARVGKVSSSTVGNWRRDLGYLESSARKFATNLGVSMRWLRDGIGDEAVQVAQVKSLFEDGHVAQSSARVAEDPAHTLYDSIDYIKRHGTIDDVRMLEDILLAARRRIFDRKRE